MLHINTKKEMSGITKLKQSEYNTGATLAFENSRNLLDISTIAAHQRNFGIASSLCVLALEELTKSVVLKLKSINNSIPIRDLEKFFWNHEHKQNAGIEFYLKLDLAFSNELDGEDDMGGSGSEIVFPVIVIALLISWYFIQSEREGQRIKKSKSYFDEIKETGFYVGWDKETKMWYSPSLLHNESSYFELLEISNDFSKKVEKWIFSNQLNKENVIQFAEKLDENIINKEQLQKIIKSGFTH